MGNLYETLNHLCEERGITGYRMCKDCGMQPSIMTDLKVGRRFSVKAETASRLANYFGVSVDYLLGKEEDEKELIGADLIKDEFIGFYGEVREKLTQDDVDDILQLMRIRAELRKDKEEKEQRRKENDT